MAAVIGATKPPRPTECLTCGEGKRVEQHCPKSRLCNWSRCQSCGAITAVVQGQLKAIAGRM